MSKIEPKHILALREKLSESQETFAKRFPTTGTTVGRWERSESKPQPIAQVILQKLMTKYEINIS